MNTAIMQNQFNTIKCKSMKINLISDTHLNWADLELPGGDILIAAGDIMEAGHFRRADNAKKDTFLADRYRRFIREEWKHI